MKQTANRRQLKNYLIVNKFHFKLLVINLVYALMIFAVIILAVLCPFYRDIFQISDIYGQHYSAKFFIVLLNRLSIALLVLLLFTLLYQVMINHKFCGPLINFSKIFLRRYDFLKNEAAQVNGMIDSLSEHILIIKREYALLLCAIEDMSRVEMEHNDYQNAIETLKKQADICNKHLSVFKIDHINNREKNTDPTHDILG